MDIQPHPHKEGQVVVTVDNETENAEIAHTPLLTKRSVAYALENITHTAYSDYPRALTLTRRQLGRIAGQALAQSGSINFASVETGLLIADFLAEHSSNT